MPELYRELINLADSDMYPFHMPGHKRNVQSTPLKGAFRCDITEIDGFDNLHQENGLILEAEKRAAKLYNAEKSFFLVNGSTSGVLAAISACVKENGTILAARGSHKSFYHAAYLRHLNIDYLPIKMLNEYGIFDGYSGYDVERALDEGGRAEAVFITSPTYEGRCSNIEEIAKVCHRKGIPLIVDAAHGAHFGLGEGVPDSAVHLGADVVINSLHKTLPSMTQTAIIHINGNLIDEKKIKRFLSIYQSSSPSYILMSSIDLCIKEMEEKGEAYCEKLLQYRNMVGKEAEGFENIRIPGTDILQDPAKILISSRFSSMTGQQLYDILREEYHLQLEMAGEKYALAIITGWDTEDGILRLISALREIDARGSSVLPEMSAESDNEDENFEVCINELPKRALFLSEAWDDDKEIVPLSECEGRISGEFINLYPPGIPLIIPGEVIDKKLIEDISRYLAKDLNVQGVFQVKNGENKGIIGKRGLVCVKPK